jgi:hypothetical protein
MVQRELDNACKDANTKLRFRISGKKCVFGLTTPQNTAPCSRKFTLTGTAALNSAKGAQCNSLGQRPRLTASRVISAEGAELLGHEV